MFEKVLKTTLRSILGETFVADSDYYVHLFVTRFFSNIYGLKVDLKFFFHFAMSHDIGKL